MHDNAQFAFLDKKIHMRLALSLFCGLTAAEKDALWRDMEVRSYSPGETIFAQTAVGDRVHVIGAGAVKISRTATTGSRGLIGVLNSGDLFGWGQDFDEDVREVRAVAGTAVTIGSITCSLFDACLTERPEFSSKILKLMARRIRAAENRRIDQGSLSPAGRLAKALIDLGRRFGVMKEGECVIGLDVTQLEVSQLIGVSRDAIYKLMRQFAESGWVRYQRRKIWLLDLPTLAGLAS